MLALVGSGCLGAPPSTETPDTPTSDHTIRVSPVNETGDDGPVIQNGTALLAEHDELREVVMQTPQSGMTREISPETAHAIRDDVGAANFYLFATNETYRVTLIKEA
jgi:hypothetical protein